MEERKEYLKIDYLDEFGNVLDLVSEIDYKDSKKYILCSDGNFYEYIEENKYKKIDEKLLENKELLKDLREIFEPGFSDVINSENYENQDEIIVVDFPEI